jgi:hypothetical protein
MSHVDELPDPNAIAGRRACKFNALPDGLKPLSHHTTSECSSHDSVISTPDVSPSREQQELAHRDRVEEVKRIPLPCSGITLTGFVTQHMMNADYALQLYGFGSGASSLAAGRSDDVRIRIQWSVSFRLSVKLTVGIWHSRHSREVIADVHSET